MCPAVTGHSRPSPGVHAKYAPKLAAASVPQSSLYSRSKGFVPAVQALGVDLQQDLNGVPGPLSNLGRRNPPVEPGRHSGVRRRTQLQILSTQRILGIWEGKAGTASPRHMLEIAQTYLCGLTSYDDAYQEQLDFGGVLFDVGR